MSDHNETRNTMSDQHTNETRDVGCCGTCEGTGRTYDSSTGGMCWDCRGTGCAHEGPCEPGDVDRCPECNAPEVIVERFDDQIGYEERARPVVVTVLGCGHEIVTPGRWVAWP